MLHAAPKQYFVKNDHYAREVAKLGYEPKLAIIEHHFYDGSGSYEPFLVVQSLGYVFEAKLSMNGFKRLGVMVTALGHKPNGDAIYAI